MHRLPRSMTTSSGVIVVRAVTFFNLDQLGCKHGSVLYPQVLLCYTSSSRFTQASPRDGWIFGDLSAYAELVHKDAATFLLSLSRTRPFEARPTVASRRPMTALRLYSYRSLIRIVRPTVNRIQRRLPQLLALVLLFLGAAVSLGGQTTAPTLTQSPEAIADAWIKASSKYDARRAEVLAQVDREAEIGPFRPDWASLSKFEAPEWYKDAKFGIFIHWGRLLGSSVRQRMVSTRDVPQGQRNK